jgi:hypothetical protein
LVSLVLPHQLIHDYAIHLPILTPMSQGQLVTTGNLLLYINPIL